MWVIDWDKFLNAQKKLDAYIFEKKNESYSSTTDKRLLGLIVELSELANATKCFKFWSGSKGDRSDILEEYVDVLHFILSFAIEANMLFGDISFPSEVDESKINNGNLVNLFLKLQFLSSKLREDKKNVIFSELLTSFLLLGRYLGFSWDEIEEGYFRKQDINYQRQDKKVNNE